MNKDDDLIFLWFFPPAFISSPVFWCSGFSISSFGYRDFFSLCAHGNLRQSVSSSFAKTAENAASTSSGSVTHSTAKHERNLLQIQDVFPEDIIMLNTAWVHMYSLFHANHLFKFDLHFTAHNDKHTVYQRCCEAHCGHYLLCPVLVPLFSQERVIKLEYTHLCRIIQLKSIFREWRSIKYLVWDLIHQQDKHERWHTDLWLFCVNIWRWALSRVNSTTAANQEEAAAGSHSIMWC